jgi:hypothetical protein
LLSSVILLLIGLGGLVTGETVTIAERIMRMGVHQAAFISHMRIVTFAAVDLTSGQPQMITLKVVIVPVMAVKTLCRNIRGKQGSEPAVVRPVAIETITILDRGMYHPALVVSKQFIVAGEAQRF